MLAAKARCSLWGLLQDPFQPSGIWLWSRVCLTLWKVVIPLQEVWLGDTGHKPPSVCWVLEDYRIMGRQSSVQLRSASWEHLSTGEGVIFLLGGGPAGHVASTAGLKPQKIFPICYRLYLQTCMPEGGHVLTAGGCTMQPTQGTTVSWWKVSATTKTMCRHGNLSHTFSWDPVSFCWRDLSPPQLQSTPVKLISPAATSTSQLPSKDQM